MIWLGALAALVLILKLASEQRARDRALRAERHRFERRQEREAAISLGYPALYSLTSTRPSATAEPGGARERTDVRNGEFTG